MTEMNFARRQFLGMGVVAQHSPLRPPWALVEQRFQEYCIRCTDCITICPETILIQESLGSYPRVDFTKGECTFCGDCVTACPTKALSAPQHIPWSCHAHVTSRCLTEKNIVCLSCAEHCDAEAIQFPPIAQQVAKPKVNHAQCTGCGACVAAWPSQAIEVNI